MTQLFIVFGLLTLLTILLLILPLWRTRQLRMQQDQMNVAIYKVHTEELAADLAEGRIDDTAHQQALEELETSLGLSLDAQKQPQTHGKKTLVAGVISVLVLAIAAATYSQVNQLEAIQTANTPQPSLDTLISRLEQRLQNQPNNPEGWQILARTYETTEQFPKAVAAYRKANQYQPDDPALLVKLGYAIVVSQKGDFSGEPLSLFKRVLALDSKNQDAQYLIGRAHFRAKNYQQALDTWQALFPQLSPVDQKAVQEDIRIVQQKLGLATTEPAEPTPAARSIRVYVRLGEGVRANPSHTVFVSAHAAQGPPMPLAVQKLTVADLPATVTLDESMAMVPQMHIGAFDKLLVKARISASGTALPQAGDMSGQATVINDKTSAEITIKTPIK